MIRKYKTGDEKYIAQIYRNAIFQLASSDYTQEQLDAWAGPPVTPEKAIQRCNDKQPFVNERDGQVVGFIELDLDGHIDCVFVHPAYARQGVMSEIMEEIKRVAKQNNISRLYAEVSKTARPFFEYHGFVWIKDIVVNARGVPLANYIMEYFVKAEQRASSDDAARRECPAARSAC